MSTDHLHTKRPAIARIHLGVKHTAFRLIAWVLGTNWVRAEADFDFIKQPIEPLRGRTERSKISSCY